MGRDLNETEGLENTKEASDCIFCKIISGEIPAVKLGEDDEHILILDQFPTVEGQALVITKQHYDSYVFDMPRVAYKQLMLSAKKFGKYLDKGMRAERIIMVAEGLGVNHTHIKLYPVPEGFEGGITTQQGHKKTTEELNKIASKIKANS
jgi:diadenosine tetraphosphate (Ap4A) HIT family hydrolase